MSVMIVLSFLSWWQGLIQDYPLFAQVLTPEVNAPVRAELKDPDADQDGDGVIDKTDDCPFLAGTDGGCPEVTWPTKSRVHNLEVVLYDDENYSLIETDEIRRGDIFSAGYLDTDTGEVYGESALVEVTQ